MTFEARRIRQSRKQNPVSGTAAEPSDLRAGTSDPRGSHVTFSRIISANVPEVALGVATAKAPPAIVLVFDLDDDLGPSSNSAVIDRIGVGDDQVRTLRGPAKRGRSGLHLAEPIVAQRTQHNHSVAERQLGVRDAAAAVFVDGVGAKAERIAKPTDHALGVAVPQARNNCRAGHLHPPSTLSPSATRLGGIHDCRLSAFEALSGLPVGWRAIRISARKGLNSSEKLGYNRRLW